MIKACCISRGINKQAAEILKSKNIQIDVWKEEKAPTQEELKQLLKEYDILIIGVKQKITKDMLETINKPKIIGTLSIGTDHIDKECLESDLIHIANCPKSNVTSVAEHIFALILELSKGIQEANNLVLEGKGDKKFLTSKPRDINHKTLGLIGAGNISRKVIEIANIFQMPVLCYTLHPQNHRDLEQKGVKLVNLEEVLQNSDILSVNIPLTEKTRNLISKEKINLLKKDSIFVNTSRDEVADVSALLEYADQNPNFYLGLDIDIPKYEKQLAQKRKNVVVTPHIAGCTEEAIQRTYIECANHIVQILEKIRQEASELKSEER